MSIPYMDSDGCFVLVEPDPMIEAMMDRQYERVPGERKWKGLAPGSVMEGATIMPAVKPKEVSVMRGVGDAVKKVTDFFGIPQCGGCAGRQEWLNKKLPFASKEPTP